jgi:hypothetical protein
VSLATFFHAIDSWPVRWTGPEAGDWSREFAVDRNCASGLVSTLVISVVVKLSISLRKWRRAGVCARCGRPSVDCAHPDHGREVAGAHTGHTAASTTRALTSRAVAACRMCNEWRQNPRSFEPAKHGRERRSTEVGRGLYICSLIDARIAAPESCATESADLSESGKGRITSSTRTTRRSNRSLCPTASPHCAAPTRR